jgi:TolB-like protein/Flp pilus assembly protein TadD
VAATRRLAAIMFTDMVGFTASAQTNEASALKLLREQERLVRPLLKTHKGREIKSTGDGFLVEFESALRAVQCAIDIHQHLQERNSQRGVTPIQLRIGIHLGDVEERGSDIFGDAVNIASRIQPLAPPGGICISGQVFDQVRNKIPNRLEKLAPTALKHVLLPLDIYRVTLPWEAPEAPSRGDSRARLAVLPLANISPDPKDEYFADGLTEELISALSKIPDLRVIARTSVGQYKSTTKTVSQIGAELGVSSVLEGSVRKAGNRLRITVQLIDITTQDHIWANNYDRELDDVFAIQTEVAERTAEALRLELLGPQHASLRKNPTSNLAAYNLYLKGIHALRRADAVEGYAEAMNSFEAALREDPNFSQTYSQLANLYIGSACTTLPAREAFPRAKELIAKALELDPNSSDVHTALGNLALQQDHHWAIAEREFNLALSLNPSNVSAHTWYATFLGVVNRFEEQLEHYRIAIELDPLDERASDFLIWQYYMSGEFTKALASAEERRDSHPRDPIAHITLGFLYAYAGRMDDAQKEVERSAGPVSAYDRRNRALLWNMLGRPEEVRQLVAELEEAARTNYVPPSQIALLYAALGEREKAFEWLERDYQSGDESLWYDYHLRAWDRFRDDPRFRSMLTKLNLPTDVRWARGSGGMF